MARFVSYLRVSTRKQGQSGLGLEAQRESVGRFVAGGEILAEFIEIESGKRADRPQLQKAIAHAKAARAVLVCARLDRVGRRASHVLSLLDDAGVDVRFADNPDADGLTLGILAVIAEAEGKAISERTRRALKAAKDRGTKLGNPASAAVLAAYRQEHGNRAAVEGAAAAADEFAGRLEFAIRAAMEAGCESANAIAGHLNAAGFVTRRGKTWTHRQVSRLLQRLEIDLQATQQSQAT